ncbi:hypothetical protein EDB84DRAFT_1577717 [Lactarius hengduanensis]|nr:hypothetical protein EDB84DRAFT_1577717 [Lactarius hengduanensis]
MILLYSQREENSVNDKGTFVSSRDSSTFPRSAFLTVRPLFSETPNLLVVGKRLVDIRGLLDRLDACLYGIRNERVTPESSRLEPFLPTVSRPSPSVTRKPDLPTVQRLAPPSHVTSADEPGTFLPPDRTPSTTDGRTMGDAASASAVLQHSTALQEELAAQLAHMAGQLRRNAEHFSRRAGGGPEGVRRVAEEKVGANHEVMKRERERLCDRR